jgi:hypothetical protein
MEKIEEQIFVIYSCGKTDKRDIDDIEKTIENFKNYLEEIRKKESCLEGLKVNPKSKRYEIPQGSDPGRTTASDIKECIESSIGAIAFLDDLRANVAYEIGYFHGQGRKVMLLTKKKVGETWEKISDLAGVALTVLKPGKTEEIINEFLLNLYKELQRKPYWNLPILPDKARNILNKSEIRNQLTGTKKTDSYEITEGEFGKSLIVKKWKGVDIKLGYNIRLDSEFSIALRTRAHNSEYSIYFKIRYTNNNGQRTTLWLGLTSRKRGSRLAQNERTIPAQAATEEWRLLYGSFKDLLKEGEILGFKRVEHIEEIRFRSGDPISKDNNKKNEEKSRIEIGYVNFCGKT